MKLSIRECAIFAMLGALMYASKILMEVLPNVHLLTVFVIAFTVVYRKKALYPIYIFVFLLGMFNGFSLWWLPYCYIWTIPWAMVMLIPAHWSSTAKIISYTILCSAHGFLYGILYAPAQALIFGLNLEGMIAWIIAGFPFDVIHGVSNLAASILIVPLIRILRRLEHKSYQHI